MIEILVFFVLSVVIGLMFVFFGYPFFRVLLPIWAFFAGISFGISSLSVILGSGLITGTLGLVLGIILGIILAAIAYYVYSLAVYLFGLTVGYVLASGFLMAIGAGGFLATVVGIGAAILFVVIFAILSMPRFLVVLLTAAAGAMGVIMGLLVLFGRVPEVFASLQLTSYIVANSWFWVMVWAALAAIGIGFQYILLTVFGKAELSEEYVWKKEYKKI